MYLFYVADTTISSDKCPYSMLPHDGCCFCLQGQQYYEDIDRYPHHRCSGTTIASEFTATGTLSYRHCRVHF